MPSGKANDAIGVRGPATGTAVLAAFGTGLRGHALNLTGDRDWDLDEVRTHGNGTAMVYEGYHRDHLRLIGLLDVHSAASGLEVSVALIATHADLEADPALMQPSATTRPDPRCGNPLLVARCYHVVIFCLCAGGCAALTNQPINASVRQHYERMGFDGGVRLDLSRADGLEKSFAYVDQVYRASGLSLSLPPLPL